MAEITERLSAKTGTVAKTGSAINIDVVKIGDAELFGAQQNVVLSDKTKKMNLKSNRQKVTVIKHDSILLAVTQGEKTVAYIENIDGKSVLRINQEYFDTLAGENETIRALGGSAENGYYSLNISNTRLGQDLSLQDLQISGTDGQTFSVSFSALGCHLSGNGTTADLRNTNNLPFDMAVSTQFMQNALNGLNGCSYGEGNKKITDKVMQNLLISSIRLERESQGENTKPITQTFGLFNIISVPYSKTESHLNSIEFFVDTRNNQVFVYHHSIGTASGEEFVPMLSRVRDCQLQADEKGNYQLSLGLGSGDGQRLVVPVSHDREFVDNISFLQGTLLSKQFAATQDLLHDGAAPVERTLPGTDGMHKFQIFGTPQEGEALLWDENVATLQRTIVEKVEEVEENQTDDNTPDIDSDNGTNGSENGNNDDSGDGDSGINPVISGDGSGNGNGGNTTPEEPKTETPDGSGNGDGNVNGGEDKGDKKEEKPFKPLIGRIRTPFKWFKKNAIDKDWFGGLAVFVLLVGALIPPVAILGGAFLGLWVAKKTGLADDWSKMMDEIEASRLPKDKRLERNKELTKQMLKEDCQKAQQREIDKLAKVAKSKVDAYNKLVKETPTLKEQAKAKMEAARQALIQEKTDKIQQSKTKLSASIQAQIDGQQAEIDKVEKIKKAQEELSQANKHLQELEKERARMLKKYSKKSYIDQYGSAESALQNEGTQEEITRFGEIIANHANTLTVHGVEKPEDIQAAIDANRAELEGIVGKKPGAYKAYVNAHNSTIKALTTVKATVDGLTVEGNSVGVIPSQQGLLVGESAQDLVSLNDAIGEYNNTNTAIANGTDEPMQNYNQTLARLDQNLETARTTAERARQDLQSFQDAVKAGTDKFSVEYKQKAQEMDEYFQKQIDEIKEKEARKKAEEEDKKRRRRAKRIKHEALSENEHVEVDENGLIIVKADEIVPQQQQPQVEGQQNDEEAEIDPVTGKPKGGVRGTKGGGGADLGENGGGGVDLGGGGK